MYTSFILIYFIEVGDCVQEKKAHYIGIKRKAALFNQSTTISNCSQVITLCVIFVTILLQTFVLVQIFEECKFCRFYFQGLFKGALRILRIYFCCYPQKQQKLHPSKSCKKCGTIKWVAIKVAILKCISKQHKMFCTYDKICISTYTASEVLNLLICR